MVVRKRPGDAPDSLSAKRAAYGSAASAAPAGAHRSHAATPAAGGGGKGGGVRLNPLQAAQSAASAARQRLSPSAQAAPPRLGVVAPAPRGQLAQVAEPVQMQEEAYEEEAFGEEAYEEEGAVEMEEQTGFEGFDEVLEQQVAEEEEDDEEDDDNGEEDEVQTFIGCVKSKKGKDKFFIHCQEVLDAFDGRDAKVTWKSQPPPGMEVGDWVSFLVMNEFGGAGDWGSPIAVQVKLCDRPQGVVLPWEEDGWEIYESGPKKSAAVEKYLKSTGSVAGVNQTLGKSVSAAKRGIAAIPGKPFQKMFLTMPEALAKEDRDTMSAMRKELEISVQGPQTEFPPIVAFEELAGVVPDHILSCLEEAQMETPMPIQAQALPLVMAGNDLFGIAKSGSGKTLAYLIPAIVHVEAQASLAQGAPTPIALILAPTREAVVRIAAEAQLILQSSDLGNHPGGVGAVALFGAAGQSKNAQISALKEGCHIVAATPVRLLELVESGAVSLSRVTFLVVDDADRILEFGDQVCSIAAQVRPDRHTLLFSATLPPVVRELITGVCHDQSKVITLTVGQAPVGGGAAASVDISHEVVVFNQPSWEARDKAKAGLLFDHLREVFSVSTHKGLVFVSNKKLADEVCKKLWDEGVKCQAMYGGKSKENRQDILGRFGHGDLRLIVTTDTAAAAFAMPDISHVVIYDMGEIEDYVSRSGRASRGSYGQGHTLAFFEFDKKWSHLAGDLIEVLNHSGQDVPPELVEIADTVASQGEVVAAGPGKGRPLRAGGYGQR